MEDDWNRADYRTKDRIRDPQDKEAREKPQKLKDVVRVSSSTDKSRDKGTNSRWAEEQEKCGDTIEGNTWQRTDRYNHMVSSCDTNNTTRATLMNQNSPPKPKDKQIPYYVEEPPESPQEEEYMEPKEKDDPEYVELQSVEPKKVSKLKPTIIRRNQLDVGLATVFSQFVSLKRKSGVEEAEDFMGRKILKMLSPQNQLSNLWEQPQLLIQEMGEKMENSEEAGEESDNKQALVAGPTSP